MFCFLNAIPEKVAQESSKVNRHDDLSAFEISVWVLSSVSVLIGLSVNI